MKFLRAAFVAVAALALGAMPALATLSIVQNNVQLPSGSTVPFDFFSDGTNDWGASLPWDGTTKGAVNATDQGLVVHLGNVPDPCATNNKTNLAISTNATALTQVIAASGSTKIYICSIALVAPGATAFNFNTGTATNCASSTAALIGSTTAANGLSFAANGGITMGDGTGTIAVTAASSELCTLQSNAVQVAGVLTYVQQ